jgi:hypothetical protein
MQLSTTLGKTASRPERLSCHSERSVESLLIFSIEILKRRQRRKNPGNHDEKVKYTLIGSSGFFACALDDKKSIPNIGVFYWECKGKKHASLAGGPFFKVLSMNQSAMTEVGRVDAVGDEDVKHMIEVG